MSKAVAIMQRLESKFLSGIDTNERSLSVQYPMLCLCAWLLDWGKFLILAEWVEPGSLLHEAADLGDVLSSEEEQEASTGGN